MIFYNRFTHLWIALFVAALMLIGWWQRDWVRYLLHLGKHQLYVITSAESIEKTLQSAELDKKTQRKLELIARVRDFGQRLYALPSSSSYNTVVMLPRRELGWNITVAQPFEFETYNFYFPFVGNFGYLGFFDKDLLTDWQDEFTQRGYDVFRSGIAAYSTLGVFADPIFSNQLRFSESSLAALVLHEMAHEKLYFADDSSLSESMASFIEVEAARRFLREEMGQPLRRASKDQLKQEYDRYWVLVQRYRSRLERVFTSKIPIAEKTRKKKAIYSQLRGEIKRRQNEFRYSGLARWLLSSKEINNAALVQIARYTPTQHGFGLLLRQCEGDILCWFRELEQLRDCTPAQRKPFYTGRVKLAAVLADCR